jgi:hypothetical protein
MELNARILVDWWDSLAMEFRSEDVEIHVELVSMSPQDRVGRG